MHSSLHSDFIRNFLTNLDPHKNGYQNRFNLFCRNGLGIHRYSTRTEDGFQPHQVGTRTSRRSFNEKSNVWCYIPKVFFFTQNFQCLMIIPDIVFKTKKYIVRCAFRTYVCSCLISMIHILYHQTDFIRYLTFKLSKCFKMIS